MWGFITTELTRGLALFTGPAYSPPSPAGHSSDTTSPVYPDRPIRPLPKRPLRSRLSPEIADSILYPPAPSISKPLFYLPYNEPSYYGNGLPTSVEIAEIDRALVEAQKACRGDSKHSYHFKGSEAESDDEEGVGIIRRYEGQRQAMGLTPSRASANGAGRPEFTRVSNGAMSQSTISSNDSVDGYDSFENTNNKKKRKIPASGSLGNHHSSLSADMANMGISSSRDGDPLQVDSDSSVGHYYGTGHSAVPASSPGTGISGAGRGRYGRSGGRSASARSPLGVSTNASNAWRAGTQRREYTPVEGAGVKGKGKVGWSRTSTRLIRRQILLLTWQATKGSYQQLLQTRLQFQLHLRKGKKILVSLTSSQLRKLLRQRLSLPSLASRTPRKEWYGQGRPLQHQAHLTVIQLNPTCQPLNQSRVRRVSAPRGHKQVLPWQGSLIRTGVSTLERIKQPLNKSRNPGVHRGNSTPWLRVNVVSSKSTTITITHQRKRTSGSASFVSTKASSALLQKR